MSFSRKVEAIYKIVNINVITQVQGEYINK
jgi:hypothetical protein